MHRQFILGIWQIDKTFLIFANFSSFTNDNETIANLQI